MILVNLPCGGSRNFSAGTTGSAIAKELAIKDAVAIFIDDQMRDLSEPISSGSEVRIVRQGEALGLEVLRHDAAHLLAQAIKTIYPQARLAIGPVIENGFYYDIELDFQLSASDLPTIEEQMHNLAAQNYKVERLVLTKSKAKQLFTKLGETYKVEIINQMPEQESIVCYKQGDFIDLCRGPHALSIGYLRHFKLLKVSGSYWRGDSKNKPLQRIYGTAWANAEGLHTYMDFLKEAEERDHRKFGKTMDLFHFQEEAQGMVFWHPNGFQILDSLQKYMQARQREAGYVQVQTPMLCSNHLWEQSGHIEKFGTNMFGIKEEDKSLKPMSCPCHIQIFNRNITSYRELPIRMAEFGICHRNEASGALHGLMRVKSFTQDDAHIFCTPEQVQQETIEFCELLKTVYRELGFEQVELHFADRPQIRAGSDEVWSNAEGALLDAVKQTNIPYKIAKGEGAFYGPKLEFHLKDAIGRSWQCGTLQLDFVLPERLNAFYIDKDGHKQHPALLHRAVLGTFERFIGILLEHHKGDLPLWLCPVQVAVATVVSECNNYALNLHDKLFNLGIRSSLEAANNTIGYKIRHLASKKVPIIAIIGKAEVETDTVSLRERGGKGKVMQLGEFIEYVTASVNQRLS